MDNVPAADPNVDEIEAPRLKGHCLTILRRLRKGAASNAELKEITHRFGARIHDLREYGIAIRTFNRDTKSGLCWYRLI